MTFLAITTNFRRFWLKCVNKSDNGNLKGKDNTEDSSHRGKHRYSHLSIVNPFFSNSPRIRSRLYPFR